MKIGILTFWWTQDNYGQILQCYALQKYLTDEGHDVYLIRYLPDGDTVQTPLWKKILKALNIPLLINYIVQKKKEKKVKLEQFANGRFFDSFKNTYIKQSDIVYHSYDELKNNPPEADVYIVGSDQVWNPFYIGGNKLEMFKKIVNVYFLNFGTAKKMSYAASWGVKNLTANEVNLITPLLCQFKYVSVREESGIDLCKKCGYGNAEWVCDPTMLLSASTYRKLYKNKSISEINKPYILLYILNDKHNINIDSIYEFAKGKNLQIIYITGNGNYDKRVKYFAKIEEWLYFIDNAEYVITDSFHCGVFSIIFNKKFGIIPLVGKKTEMNVRFDSLFSIYGIESRYIKNEDFNKLDETYTPKKIVSDFNSKVLNLK